MVAAKMPVASVGAQDNKFVAKMDSASNRTDVNQMTHVSTTEFA